MPLTIDLTGQRFGRLVAVERSGSQCGNATWLCRCDCGGQAVVSGLNLKSGHTKSCGCLRRQTSVSAHLRHGHKRVGKVTRTYRIWRHMTQRCSNSHDIGYTDYGGRGIRVCERWRKFEHFLEDMGEPPPNCQIDRIDNEGDYEPNNCRWTSPRENSRNRRSNCLITYRGRTQCVAAWAEEIGVPRHILYLRLRRNWSIERTFAQSIRKTRRK